MPEPVAASSALPPADAARAPASERRQAKPRKAGDADKGVKLWLDKSLVAFLGVLGAAVAPVTTYMYKQSELEIENTKVGNEIQSKTRQQNHEIRISYFDKALDRTKDEGYRESVLAFLTLSPEDDQLSRWANSEIAQLRKRRDQIAAERAASQRDADSLTARIAKLEAELKVNQGARAGASEQLKSELQALREKRREGEQALLEQQKQQEAEEQQRRAACQSKCATTQATCVNSCENLYDGKRRETCQQLCGAELGSCTGGC